MTNYDDCASGALTQTTLYHNKCILEDQEKEKKK